MPYFLRSLWFQGLICSLSTICFSEVTGFLSRKGQKAECKLAPSPSGNSLLTEDTSRVGQLQTALPRVFSPEVFKQLSLISGWTGADESPEVQFDPGPSAPRIFGVSLRVSHFLIPHPHLLTTCGLGCEHR